MTPLFVISQGFLSIFHKSNGDPGEIFSRIPIFLFYKSNMMYYNR